MTDTYAEESCIIFFVKYPEPGQVKKRLTPPLHPAVASELYRNFILDHLVTLDTLPYSLWICFTPDAAGEQFNRWLGTERHGLRKIIGENISPNLQTN